MASLASAKWRYPREAPAPIVANMTTGKKPKSTELRALIARRLRAARMAYNPNGAEVARALDMDPRSLTKYEKGRLYPDEAFVVAFCQLTECPADWLYLGRITREMPPDMAARIAFSDPDLVAAAAGAAGGRSVPAKQTVA